MSALGAAALCSRVLPVSSLMQIRALDSNDGATLFINSGGELQVVSSILHPCSRLIRHVFHASAMLERRPLLLENPG